MGQARIKRLNREREAAARAGGVFIDTSEVGPIGLAHEKFQSEFDDIAAAFRNPTTVRGVAVHESGHAMRFAIQGADEFFLRGPRMFFDPAFPNDPFTSHGASVEEGSNPVNIPTNLQGIYMMTARFVSGGVASQVITQTPQAALQKEILHDWQEYLRMCANIEHQKFATINREKHWNEVWDKVKLEMQNPKLVAAVLATAATIERLLYDWRGDALPFKCVSFSKP